MSGADVKAAEHARGLFEELMGVDDGTPEFEALEIKVRAAMDAMVDRAKWTEAHLKAALRFHPGDHVNFPAERGGFSYEGTVLRVGLKNVTVSVGIGEYNRHRRVCPLKLKTLRSYAVSPGAEGREGPAERPGPTSPRGPGATPARAGAGGLRPRSKISPYAKGDVIEFEMHGPGAPTTLAYVDAREADVKDGRPGGYGRIVVSLSDRVIGGGVWWFDTQVRRVFERGLPA